MTNKTGKERLEKLYIMLRSNYPDKEIYFFNESLDCDPIKYFRYKVAYFIEGEQICDAIWSFGSYGNEANLLEFYHHGKPIGYITEIKAFNLFKKVIGD